MGLLSKFSSTDDPNDTDEVASKLNDHAGELALNLVIPFFESSNLYKLTENSYTELFAFIHSQFCIATGMSVSTFSQGMGLSLIEAYVGTFREIFGTDNTNAQAALFSDRVLEYYEAHNSQKGADHIFRWVPIYLNNASELDKPYEVGVSPLVLDDYKKYKNGTQEFVMFFIGSLSPVLQVISHIYRGEGV